MKVQAISHLVFNDKVRFVDGAFLGSTGFVGGVDTTTGKAQVLTHLFGREIVIPDIPPQHLELTHKTSSTPHTMENLQPNPPFEQHDSQQFIQYQRGLTHLNLESFDPFDL